MRSQFPSDAFADRFGEHRIMFIGLGITAGPSLSLAVAPRFVVFGLAAIRLGISANMYYNPAPTLLMREFDRINGTIGIHRIGGQIASVAATMVTVQYTWQMVIELGALLGVAVAGFFRWTHTLSCGWLCRRGTPSRVDAS